MKDSAIPPSALPFSQKDDLDPEETLEWVEALEGVVRTDGTERARFLLERLRQKLGVGSREATKTSSESALNTPYVNTITATDEPAYPGNLTLERRLSNTVRWNALAMVLRANKNSAGIGGHIATYASTATLYDVCYNHFFKGPNPAKNFSGDAVFFQGHASPGVYARAFLEGKISEAELENFRRELKKEGGLSSYSHPRLMPNFWQFPTVSMGLGPLMAIYLARFNKYLLNRGLKDTSQTKVYAFIGDGETDEVETLGALSIAKKERLDNLIFIINCNLQRLDGPVRGNGKIIQQLEGIFKGAGWKVIKVIWGSDWDPLFAEDSEGKLVELMEKTVDGEYQLVSSQSGSERRAGFFSNCPVVKKIVSKLSDEALENLRRGGHDEKKIYAALHRALQESEKQTGFPTVILVKTIKGYGMGESGQGRNIAHQQKSLSADDLEIFKEKFSIPIPKEQLQATPFYQLAPDDEAIAYLKKQRETLGPMLPLRLEKAPAVPLPSDSAYQKTLQGTKKRAISTTMAMVQLLSALLREKEFSKHIVPIVPDESRTFGMEGLFREYEIYSAVGQLYTPVDKSSLMPYKESKSGQIFQEGINEAGAAATFIAAGTSYSHQGLQMLPFYIFYSMFGFQRTGDLFWAAADAKTRGFLLGGTAGRTTLNGEGLQHQDGHSHLLAATLPNVKAYDPAFGYEVAAVVREGIKRMMGEQKDEFYYLTLYNENYPQPAMPEEKREALAADIVKGMYLYEHLKAGEGKKARHINLLLSGVMVPEGMKAARWLNGEYKVNVRVYSVTSFKALREEAIEKERAHLLRPEEPRESSHLEKQLAGSAGGFVACTDHMRLVPELISRFLPRGRPFIPLGTDGFGCSSSREELREYFEISEKFIALAALQALAEEKKLDSKELLRARALLKINPEKDSGLSGKKQARRSS